MVIRKCEFSRRRQKSCDRYGRWAYAGFTEVFQIQPDFKATIDADFNKLIEKLAL